MEDFPSKRNLEDHLNRVHVELKDFKCDVCEKTFFKFGDFRDHFKSNHLHQASELTCNICEKPFDKSQFLKCHIKNFHNSKMNKSKK